jgi:hydrogenase small subunit
LTRSAPKWLFGATVHEGCDRGGYYEQARICRGVRIVRQCIVKLGCWGPVVQCNVGKRGWMGGIGGCPNVGGICIGCTMPGFPDKFMPFMDQPPGSLLSSAAVMTYGRAIHALRRFTLQALAMNREPSWRARPKDVSQRPRRGEPRLTTKGIEPLLARISRP